MTIHCTGRWRVCLEEMEDAFGMAMGLMLVQSSFPASSKLEAEEMISEVKSAFIEMLDVNDWMDDATKEAAKMKAKQLSSSAAYPDWILNTTTLNKFYEQVEISDEDHASNLKSSTLAAVKRHLRKLRDYPVDKTIWEDAPGIVNAFYSPTENSMRIFAGILQYPFFKGGNMKALNYGGIGSVIGHEFTHGFDDEGRQYDKDGEVTKWWSDEAIAKFMEKANCYIDHYASYCPAQIPPSGNTTICLDGNNTLGENIADCGGLKASFKAYRNWVSKNKEEPKLPSLDYTPDQLYFVSYAQTNCGVLRTEKLLNDILEDVHAPDIYRNLGPISNSKEFARAFNCPAGSKMNKGENRCEIW